MVFFFNDTATTEIYTLSLHDALPICWRAGCPGCVRSRSASRPMRAPAAVERSEAVLAADAAVVKAPRGLRGARPAHRMLQRSEEHTSELQSRQYLVCRLLLEKKKNVV